MNSRHAGRKPKLTTIDGDRKYQRDRSKAHQKAEKGLKKLQPSPPRYFDNDARAIWRKLIPELINIGLVRQLDLPEVELFCVHYSIYRKAVREVFAKNKNGDEKGVQSAIYKWYDTADGKSHREFSGFKRNPAVGTIDAESRMIKSLSADLGLNFNYRAQANAIVKDVKNEKNNGQQYDDELALLRGERA